MKELRLFTPGPTPLPLRIRNALSRPIIHHRSDEFKALLRSIRPQLQNVFGTRQEVMLLSSSGTGGMEAAFRSVLNSRDSVLVVDAGKFGERFAKLASAYRVKVDSLKVPWGEAVTIDQLTKALQPSHTALLIQHSETSTGVMHPLKEIALWLKQKHPQCLLFVDGITSIGACEFEMDAWGVDAAITGSQKAFMCPPGLAMVALSTRALTRMSQSDLPGFYLDLKREHEAILKDQTAFTSSVNLIFALDEALKMMNEEGLPNLFLRHRRLSASTRAALRALDLKLATESASVACTAAFFPSNLDGKAFLKRLKAETGFQIAGAQDQWEGKVMRVAHLGGYQKQDLEEAIDVIAQGLIREGYKVDSESALAAFRSAWAKTL